MERKLKRHLELLQGKVERSVQRQEDSYDQHARI